MDEHIKTAEVTKALKFFVGTTLVHEVDNEGYVLKTSDRSRLKLGDPPKDVILYQEEIRDGDAHILNPLAEGLGTTITASWFDKSVKAALIGILYEILPGLVKLALAQKKPDKVKEGEIPPHIPSIVIKIASSIVNDVDDKMEDELQRLFVTERERFLEVYDNKKQLSASIRCGLFDDKDWTDSLKIRKKSITTFVTLIRALLDLKPQEDLSRYTYKAPPNTPPRLTSVLGCLFGIYDRINEVIDYFNPDHTVDLATYRHHLERMPAYYANAKSMIITSTPSRPVPAPQAIPTQATTYNPYPTQQMPQQQRPPSGASLIPGPQMVDGREAPPTYLQPQPQPVPMGYGQPQPMFPPNGYMPNNPGFGGMPYPQPQGFQAGYGQPMPPPMIPQNYGGMPYTTIPNQPMLY